MNVRSSLTGFDAGVVVAAGLAMSSAIEAVQRLLPTRYSSTRDLIAHTLGTAAGGFAYASVVAPKSAGKKHEIEYQK